MGVIGADKKFVKIGDEFCLGFGWNAEKKLDVFRDDILELLVEIDSTDLSSIGY